MLSVDGIGLLRKIMRSSTYIYSEEVMVPGFKAANDPSDSDVEWQHLMEFIS